MIVPFAGDDAELPPLIARLASLRTRPGDALWVLDNRDAGGERVAQPAFLPQRHRVGPVTVIPAPAIATPGYARNVGAAQATTPWLIFIDADTEPVPDLLDRYLIPLPAPTTAVLGGGIRDVLPDDATPAAQHAVARAQMDARHTLERPAFPYAQSANCAIRRDAFLAAGGFDPSARAGEDADLGFRLHDLGYGLESRPMARVDHRARATLPGLLRQLATHGAGAAWCEARHPGSFPAPGARALTRRVGRSVIDAVAAARRRDRAAATAHTLDAAEALAFALGRRRPNLPKGNR